MYADLCEDGDVRNGLIKSFNMRKKLKQNMNTATNFSWQQPSAETAMKIKNMNGMGQPGRHLNSSIDQSVSMVRASSDSTLKVISSQQRLKTKQEIDR